MSKNATTIGWLIAQLENNDRAKERKEKDYEHELVKSWRPVRPSADGLFHTDPATMPGIDRIIHLCDVHFKGTGLTATNVRQLRVKLCTKLKWDSETAKCADDLTLVEAADVLEDIQRVPFEVFRELPGVCASATATGTASHPSVGDMQSRIDALKACGLTLSATRMAFDLWRDDPHKRQDAQAIVADRAVKQKMSELDYLCASVLRRFCEEHKIDPRSVSYGKGYVGWKLMPDGRRLWEHDADIIEMALRTAELLTQDQQESVLNDREKEKKSRRQPSKTKKPKKTRNRKSRVAELLIILLEDRQKANLNCTELAQELKCSISAISRAFKHRHYGPKIARVYRDFGIRPPGINQI